MNSQIEATYADLPMIAAEARVLPTYHEAPVLTILTLAEQYERAQDALDRLTDTLDSDRAVDALDLLDLQVAADAAVQELVNYRAGHILFVTLEFEMVVSQDSGAQRAA